MRIYNPSKKDISQLPFQLVFEAGRDNCKEQQQQLAMHSNWALPQILAYLGKIKPVAVEGQYDAKATAKRHLETLDLEDQNWFRGLIMFISVNPRGTILPVRAKATAAEWLPYAANVPLFLAAFKKFQNIKYKDWNIESAKPFINEDIYESMVTEAPEFTEDILLAYRTEGSTVKSGKTAGTIKNPLAATTLSRVGNSDFDQLPRLTKLMLCQCWVYHPSLWNDYMVLNQKDWDSQPKRLIDTEVLKEPKKSDPDLEW